MAGYDISAAVSESSTQGFQGGNFIVGGGGGNPWLPIALVVLAAFGLFLWFNRK